MTTDDTTTTPRAVEPDGSTPVVPEPVPGTTASVTDDRPADPAPVGPADGAAAESATADPAPVDEPADAAPAAGASGARRASALLYAAAAALVLLLVAAAVLGWQLRSKAQDDAARQAALSAARQSALNLTSVDQEGFEEDVAAILDGATGSFRSDFATRADDLESLLTENEVVAEGKVLQAALVRSDRTSATALVVVDSTVRNKETPDGRVNSYRMRLELEKVGDRWLTSELEFVG